MNRQKESRNLGIIFLMATLLMILTDIGISALNLSGKWEFPWWISSLLCEGSMVIPACIYCLKQGDRLQDVIGFKKVKFSTILWLIPFAIAAAPIYTLANVLSQLLVPNALVEASAEIVGDSMGISMFMVAFLAPFCEESAMRGVFHNRYSRITTPWKAILISSLMFGLFHLNLNQFSYAFVIGIVFCMLNRASGSIFTSMIMHGVINGFNLLLVAAVSEVASASGIDLGAATEEVRTGGQILSMIPSLIFSAALGLVFVILILGKIAHNEGNEAQFYKLFSFLAPRKQEESVSEDSDPKSVDAVSAEEFVAGEEVVSAEEYLAADDSAKLELHESNMQSEASEISMEEGTDAKVKIFSIPTIIAVVLCAAVIVLNCIGL